MAYYEKNRDKLFLQKKNSRCIQFTILVVSYVELENRLDALEEKLSIKKIIKRSNVCNYKNKFV